jgi:polypeptide N-acetylgalactosaminyltransferase
MFDAEHLGSALDDYVSKLDKVKLMRLGERLGLMQARMTGFKRVTGKVVVFLDSHCEVTESR